MNLRTMTKLRVEGLRAGAARYYVSDLHAGDGGDADDFAPNGTLFHEFAWDVGWQRLRFVGDILEGWQGFTLGSIAAAYPQLCSMLAVARGCHGNHDRRISGLPARLVEGGVLCLHGHQADPWNSRYRCLGRLLTRVAGWLERLGWKDADNPWTWRTPRDLTGDAWLRYRDYYVQGWIKRTLARERPRVLVCGHTHRAGLARWPSGQVAANCGTWASPLLPRTAVCIADDTVELLEVTP